MPTCCGQPGSSTTLTPPPTGNGCLIARYLCCALGGVSTWVLDSAYALTCGAAPSGGVQTGCVANANCTGQISCTPTECVIQLINGCTLAAPLPVLQTPWCDPVCVTTTTTTTNPWLTTTTTTTDPFAPTTTSTTTTSTTSTSTTSTSTTSTTSTTTTSTTTTSTTTTSTSTTTTTPPPTTTTTSTTTTSTTTTPPPTTTTTTTPPPSPVPCTDCASAQTAVAPVFTLQNGISGVTCGFGGMSINLSFNDPSDTCNWSGTSGAMYPCCGDVPTGDCRVNVVLFFTRSTGKWAYTVRASFGSACFEWTSADALTLSCVGGALTGTIDCTGTPTSDCSGGGGGSFVSGGIVTIS